MKKYSRPAKRHEQAHQSFMILSHFVANKCLGKMKKRGIITYGELADKMGYTPNTGVTLNVCLGVVARFCKANDLPYINAMVVNAETGEPGDEVIWDHNLSIRTERKKIRKFKWQTYEPPLVEEFLPFMEDGRREM